MVWPEIGVYVGSGASHSWTWFADIFERNSIYSVKFVDTSYIAQKGLDQVDALLVSGGDTFAIAEGLGQEGAQHLRNFIASGGVYIGSCAGAYLPLKSSRAPLNLFNFVTSRITNLTNNVPAPRKMAEKYCTQYGCQYIFHPVREAVMVRVVDGFSCTGDEIAAPLYGGPAMTASDDIEVLGVYSSFTRETEFLVDKTLADKTLIGNVAIARKRMGKGVLYLFGPHFEHPHYAAANRIVFEALCSGSYKQQPTRLMQDSCPDAWCNIRQIEKLRGEISNARIVALALERLPCHWPIGRKVYDPGKIRVFLEAIWSRIRTSEFEQYVSSVSSWEAEDLINSAQRVTTLLRNVKKISYMNEDATAEAEELFTYLKKLTADYLSIYFRIKANRLNVS